MGSVPIFAAVAALFLAAMVLLTVADVVLRALFNYPLRGMLELIELGLACAVFLGLPAVFLRRGHLVVDVLRTPPGPVGVDDDLLLADVRDRIDRRAQESEVPGRTQADDDEHHQERVPEAPADDCVDHRAPSLQCLC